MDELANDIRKNIGMYIIGIIVGIIGFFILRTLNSIETKLGNHELRIMTIEKLQAVSEKQNELLLKGIDDKLARISKNQEEFKKDIDELKRR